MRPALRYSILQITVLTVTLFILVNCKKADTTDPDMAAKVMGTYKFSTINMAGNSTAIPVTGGTAVLLRNGLLLDKVDLTLSYATASTSGSASFSETKSISLHASGSAINLLNGTTQVGTWVNNTLTFTDYPFNNSTLSFTATKQ